MNRRLQTSPFLPKRQSGMATLAISIIILFLTTLVVFAVGRAAVFEQKLTGNNIRLKEVYAAAIEGSDYGAEWMKSNAPTWTDCNGDGAPLGNAGDCATPPALANTTMGADSYSHTVAYTLLTDIDADPALIRVDSTATGVGDSHVTKTVTVYIIRAAILGGGGVINGPPLMVEECVTNVTGTPDIYPASGGLAIGTLGLNGASSDPSCVDPGHFDIHNGGTIGQTSDHGSMLDAMFGVENAEATFLQWEAEFPATFIHVDSNYVNNGYYNFNGNQWHVDVGTFSNPVILWFDSSVNCPKINGNTTIYGLVFFESANCTSNGWGGGTVYGTTAVTGDLSKFNANAQLIDYDFSQNFGPGNSVYARTTVIPGSWSDF